MRWPALVLALLLIGAALIPGSARAESTMTVSGMITNIEGDPFPGATVTIRNATSAIYTTTTNAAGLYSREVPLDNYSITATYSAYRANVTYWNVSSTSSGLDFFMYEVLGAVTGQVTDGNTTLAGVVVTLTGVNNVSFSGVSTAPLGAFYIDNVTPGTYMVSASKEGYNTSYHSSLVTLFKGSVEFVSFTLAETVVQYAKLSGRVTYSGDPLPGVKVVLTPAEGADLVTVTDDQGNYTFAQVPPGEYTIYLSKDGFVTSERKLTMEPLKGVLQDFSMKRNTLPGNSGFVLDYDLSHSMMVVGLGLALLVTVASLFLRQRIKRNPDLLAREEEPAPSKE